MLKFPVSYIILIVLLLCPLSNRCEMRSYKHFYVEDQHNVFTVVMLWVPIVVREVGWIYFLSTFLVITVYCSRPGFLLVFLTQSSCVSPVELTDRRRQERMITYKAFNVLWMCVTQVWPFKLQLYATDQSWFSFSDLHKFFTELICSICHHSRWFILF